LLTIVNRPKRARLQGKRETLRIKTRLLEQGRTITGLAKKTGYARNTVSMAINRLIFPAVLAAVRKELGLDDFEKAEQAT
jgi:lambda repressor-like predicted transcriptional regulator